MGVTHSDFNYSVSYNFSAAPVRVSHTSEVNRSELHLISVGTFKEQYLYLVSWKATTIRGEKNSFCIWKKCPLFGYTTAKRTGIK